MSRRKIPRFKKQRTRKKDKMQESYKLGDKVHAAAEVIRKKEKEEADKFLEEHFT